MKAVILAGGMGTRISEETVVRPKPMIEIGYMPILWHIMKVYSFYGINDFVICCGYKSHVIKEFFAHYRTRRSDLTVDIEKDTIDYHRSKVEPWKVTLIYTGWDTMTGGRLKRVKDYIGDETFCFTYGDGLSDVHIGKLIQFHQEQKKIATITAGQHTNRFGVLKLDGDRVSAFVEKPVDHDSWLNSGFFVLEPQIFDLIDGDSTVFEKEPIHRLVAMGQLAAFRHEGFFMGMDSLRERNTLEELWQAGKAPWKVW